MTKLTVSSVFCQELGQQHLSDARKKFEKYDAVSPLDSVHWAPCSDKFLRPCTYPALRLYTFLTPIRSSSVDLNTLEFTNAAQAFACAFGSNRRRLAIHSSVLKRQKEKSGESVA